MSNSKRQWTMFAGLGVLAACLVLSSVALRAQHAPWDRIVVFGTSFSDSGNVAILVGHSTPPAYDVDALLLPNSAYARGGQHLTNGPTWIEQLARSLALSGSVQPALQTKGVNGTNYAIGGARAITIPNPPPGFRNATFDDEMGLFLVDFNGVAPPDALYVVEMGANDVRDGLAAVAQGQDGFALVGVAAKSVANHIKALYAAGARQFLVSNVASPGYSPSVRILDQSFPGASILARQLSIAFNVDLAIELAPLDGLPGITLTRVDAFAKLDQVMAAPSAYGFSNVVDACITPDVAPFACHRPDTYFFWDGVHPTTAGHGVMAAEAAKVLGLD
jgi:outer membrane lipase/esterase